MVRECRKPERDGMEREGKGREGKGRERKEVKERGWKRGRGEARQGKGRGRNEVDKEGKIPLMILKGKHKRVAGLLKRITQDGREKKRGKKREGK